MFIVKNCWGTPVPGGVCVSKPLSFSSTCKNLSRQRQLGAEIWSSKKLISVGQRVLVVWCC